MPAKPDLLAGADDSETDGRRMRSERSRERIVEAMLALVRAGDINPSAADVADKAGVGLRTVFRHFEDKDSLYREMAAIIEAEVRPLLDRPFESRDWPDRLYELVARRAAIYERILPIKQAANIRRFESDYLSDAYHRFLTLERSLLMAVLPETLGQDARAFAALDMVTAFQAWRRLRQDQGLSPDEAEAVMRHAVERLIEA